jgi:hypothetical protein
MTAGKSYARENGWWWSNWRVERQRSWGEAMPDISRERIIERLTDIEQSYRWWQVMGGLAMVVVTGAVLMGAMGRRDGGETGDIRAQGFVLVDRDGKPRMDMRIAPNDSAHLVMMDREGLPRISLNVLTHGGADLVLQDQLGQPRAALSVLPDGRPGLSLYDALGTTRVAVGMLPDDQPRVVLYDQRGQVRWVSPLESLPGGSTP